MSKNKKIICPHLILCEGADATYFLIGFLDYLISNGEDEFNKFQVMDFGGNEELPKYLHLLPYLPNYKNVKSITIIRDAEKNHCSAVQSIQTALENSGFPVPICTNKALQDDKRKTAFTLFPSLSINAENGTLEDLFINNLVESSDELLKDIDNFINSLQLKKRNIPRKHKSRLYIYFAVTDRYITLKLAEAAKSGAFRFDCSEMNSLKELLREMCSQY